MPIRCSSAVRIFGWRAPLALVAVALGFFTAPESKKDETYFDPIDVNVPHVATEKRVKLDPDGAPLAEAKKS